MKTPHLLSWLVLVAAIAMLACGASAQTQRDIITMQQQALESNEAATNALTAGDFRTASSHYDRSCAIHRRIREALRAMPPSSREGLLITERTAAADLFGAILNKAYCLRQLGLLDEAEKAVEEARAIALELDERWVKLQFLKETASLMQARQRWGDAAQLYDELIILQEAEIAQMDIRKGATRAEFLERIKAMPVERLMKTVQVVVSYWSNYFQAVYSCSHLFDMERALQVCEMPYYRTLNEFFLAFDRFIYDDSIPKDPIFILLKQHMGNLRMSDFVTFYHTNKGAVLNDLARYGEAIEEFGIATALIPKGEGAFQRAVLFNAKGYSCMLLKRNAEALALFGECRTLAASLKPPFRDIWSAVASINIAWLLRESGDLEGALASADGAISLIRALGDPEMLWVGLHSRGRTLYQLGRYQEAYTAQKEAIDIIEGIRALIGSERHKRTFMTSKTEVYDLMIRILEKLNRPELSFEYAERGKARAFIDLLGGSEKTRLLKKNAPGQLREEIARFEAETQELQASRGRVADEMAGFSVSGTREASFQKASAAYEKAVKDEDKYRNLLEKAGAEFADLVMVQPIGARELGELLGPDSLLVEYFVGDVERCPVIFVADGARLAKGGAPEVITMDLTGEELAEYVAVFRKLLTSPGRQQEMLKESSQSLYNNLVAPVESRLAGKKRLVVVPHGPLSFLPFGALADGDGKYLVEKLDLASLPSATTLRYCRKKGTGRTGSILAYALGDTAQPGLSPLPGTLKELGELETLFTRRPDSFFTGNSLAMKEFARLAPGRDLIHLATHGLLDPASPMESAIVLGTDRLRVGEVMTFDLSANLVVLSACKTGLGKIYKGDEIVGLTRAFIYAGTPSVLSSLWSVADDSTAMLMVSFYRHLRGGADKAHALRLAQNETRAKYPEPFNWAPFILTGDWK